MFKSNQWQKRAWGWQLEFAEISKTKNGGYRLWDSTIAGTGDATVGIYDTLAAAKRAGCKMLNEAMVEGSAECDSIFWGGGLYAST